MQLFVLSVNTAYTTEYIYRLSVYKGYVIIHLTTFHSKLKQVSRKRVESSCGEDCFTLQSSISMHSICTDLYATSIMLAEAPSRCCCLLNLSIYIRVFFKFTSSLAPSARRFIPFTPASSASHLRYLPLPPTLFSTFGFSLRLLRLSHSALSPPLSQQPSPSTSTNILIIPWKRPRLRVLTRSWKTRPSVPPRGSALSFLPSLPSRASPNFALELHSLFHSAAALPFRSPLSPSTFVTMESIRTLESRLVVW